MDRYGFQSDNGWFPALNASISVIVNQDHDSTYPNLVTCHVVSIVARSLGLSEEDLGCKVPDPNPMYVCSSVFGEKICTLSHHSEGDNLTTCEESCS